MTQPDVMRATLRALAGAASCFLVASGVAALGACGGSPAPPPPPAPVEVARVTVAPPAASGPEPEPPLALPGPLATARVKKLTAAEAGLDPEAIDRGADPCVDLYRHACGRWVDTFQIPPHDVTYEKTFSAGSDRTEARLREILESIPEKGATARQTKLRDFYRACMDVEAIEKRGTRPIDAWLGRTKRVRTRDELARLVGEVHPIIDAFFHFGAMAGAGPDVVARVAPGGTRGLVSDRDWLDPSPEKVALRDAYREHAVRMLRLAHFNESEARVIAADAVAVQIELARGTTARGDEVTWSVDEIERTLPGFPWKRFFAGIGFTGGKSVRVFNRQAIEKMAAWFQKTDVPVLAHYTTWRIVSDLSPVLGRDFRAERNALSSVLWGPHAEEPRWAVCVAATRKEMRDPLTEQYVAKYLSADAPASFREMFASFVGAFDGRMGELDWMDEATRDKAREKLQQIVPLIGYPDAFPDYTEAVTKNHADNVLGAGMRRIRARLAKPAPAEVAGWRRSPLETNAWVDYGTHSVVFPAAFLQPPFYDPKTTLPVRYGAIGFHLGHELTHHFDNQGARYDAAGKRASWWSPEMWKRFEDKTSCLEKQYAAYEPVPGKHVDAKMTLGENIADLGGLKLAFRAYRYARKDAAEVTVADGYTEDQQFFLSYAQDHCVKFGARDLEVFLAVNPHSPHWLRVNGVVQNLPEFAHAFGCKRPAKEKAPPRCEVW